LVLSQSSGEVEIVSPVDPPPLVVSARREAQRDRGSMFDQIDRDEEAPIEFQAVRAYGVDLRRRVGAPNESLGTSAGALTTDHENFASARGPLALHANEPRLEIEDHVVAPALSNWSVHLDSELERGGGDAGLRDRSLLIRCHGSQRTDRIGWAVSPSDTRNPATIRGEPKEATEPLNSLEQARRIAGLAEEKLAQDIVILDMRPVCAYTDFFVVCSGQNPRQTKAIVDEVRYGLKHDDERLLPHSVEGEREGEWIVADYLDVVLHVFTPQTRDYYGLEELWDDVPSIEHATA
jgi:ribosome-associated protein